jgi:hypothetical protein
MAEDEFPKKWLDSKKYVRMDSKTGQPQLVQIEPMVTEIGELIPDTVMVYVDNDEPKVMERNAAFAYVETQGCVPVEKVAQWKHKKIN